MDATTIAFLHKASIPSAPCMASSTISKKRKRGADDDEKVTLQLSSEPASKAGPVLGTYNAQFAAASDASHRFRPASFPSLEPPKVTAFKYYVQKNRDKTAPFEAQPTLVVGETETVEFFSADGPLQSTGCRYVD